VPAPAAINEPENIHASHDDTININNFSTLTITNRRNFNNNFFNMDT
jgi:hypothetical protein